MDPGGPAWLVQVEQAALHRVERGQLHQQLGHRGPAERPGGRAGDSIRPAAEATPTAAVTGQDAT